MIHDAAATLIQEHGFSQVEQVTDPHGTIGYVLEYADDLYCLVAKEYAYDGKASFLARLVTDGPQDMRYVFYNNDDSTYTVFDGKYLRENAAPSSGPSKKRDCEWREIDLAYGADLGQYLRGEESPTTLAGQNRTLGGFA